MKKLIQTFLVFSIVVLTTLHAPRMVACHGTAFKLLQEPTVSAVKFHYSDGEPMMYADVLVFSPEDSKVEHQNGRTDRHGKFAFCPDTPGTWRINANDGMGHLCEATVEIRQGAAIDQADTLSEEKDTASPFEGAKVLKIIAGLSLIGNLACIACLFRRRSNTN